MLEEHGPVENRVEFLEGDRVEVANIRFHCSHPSDPSRVDGELRVVKPPSLVRRYVDLCRDLEPRVIVELGIMDGGGTALLATLASPDLLLAFDLRQTPAHDLEAFIAERALGDVIRPFYGVDQADRPRLLELTRHVLGERKVDLVVDDASHDLRGTRASFETLFPLVRPGGRFIVEDWSSLQQFADAAARALASPGSEGWRQVLGNLENRARAAVPVEDETRRDVLERCAHELARAQRDPHAPIDLARIVEDLELPRPTTPFVLQLLLAHIGSPDAIAEIHVSPEWLTVHRGPAELDPEHFSVRDLFNDHQGLISS